MSHVDYYETLGLKKTASDDEIKSSYKMLAKKWHPDRNQNNRDEAENKFKEISEAYTVLSDPKKKDLYDKHGINGLKENENGMSQQDAMEMMMGGMGGLGGMVNMMMGGFGGMGGMGGNIEDVKVGIEVDLQTLYTGASITQTIDRKSFCDKCDGTGSKDKTTDINCKQCKGQGMQMIKMGHMIAQKQCGLCKGSGVDPKVTKCKKCNGDGLCKERVDVEVVIPKGAFDRFPIVIEGEGNQIPVKYVERIGKNRTDIIFVIVEKEHDVFKRGFAIEEKKRIDQSDLLINLSISFTDSLAGFHTVLTHLDGEKITIGEELCRHNDKFVLIGYGMPKLTKDGKETNEKGDLIIQLEVQHPKEAGMSDATKKELKKLLSGDKKHKSHPNVIKMMPFDKYKKTVKIQAESEEAREKYNRRKMKKNSDLSDDDDDNAMLNAGLMEMLGAGLMGMMGGDAEDSNNSDN